MNFTRHPFVATVLFGMLGLAGCGSSTSTSDSHSHVNVDSSSGVHASPGETVESSDVSNGRPVENDLASAEMSSEPAEMSSEPEQPVGKSIGESQDADKQVTESADLLAAESDPAAQEPDESKSTAAETYAYRLWLPTTRGPALVGLNVTLDDQPLKDAFEEKLAHVLRSAKDQGESGNTATENQRVVTWEKMLSVIASDAETFGQSISRMAAQPQNIIKQYDRNKNETVEADELKRFLFRSANFHTEFRLLGTDAFRWVNRSESGLFRSMDTNGDRRLDAEEIDQASASLLHLVDGNVDGCISLTEAISRTESDENAWNAKRSARDGNVAMDLSGYINWGNLSYSMGGMLKSAHGPLAERLFVSLNRDSDRWISEEEAKSILGLPPLFAINLSLYSAKRSPAEMTVFINQEDSSASVESNDSGQSALVHAMNLRISVENLLGNPRQDRIPIDAFTQLDANQDGGIDETEIPAGAEDQIPFESLDENRDGKLSFMEINQAVKQKESIWNYQLRGRAAEHPDGVFGYLDLNQDQFLSSREIYLAPARLRELVGDSGSIRSNQIPDTYTLRFGRGEPEQDNSRFEIKRKLPSDADPRPRWAQRMDANSDGEISENEFLGPIETFRSLDTNADRFLTSNEVMTL